jgi:hypothetical protein
MQERATRRALESRGDSSNDSWGTSWRTYLSFALVGALFILCQAISGRTGVGAPDETSSDPGDRSYREAVREETSGRASGVTLPNVNRPLAAGARSTGSGGSSLQTD